MKKTMTTLLASLALTVGLNAATFDVDKAHSSVNFKVKHMMISNVTGTFDDFSGLIEYDEEAKILKSIKGTIKADSINTGIEKRDKHLRNDDFFNAPKYPNITFVADKIEGDKAHGMLTMRDVKKPVTLEIEFGGVIKDPWGNQRIGLTLEGEIDRRDFNLKYNSVLDTGGVSVGYEVKLTVELEAIKQK